jgi:hypothetical protein
MIAFEDEQGRRWVATVREEDTPRHHGRFYLVFHPEGDDLGSWPLTDVRWQNAPTAERTLRTMAVFELRRRLGLALRRAGPARPEAAPVGAAAAARGLTDADAG